jgi:hypothetical protein
MSRANAFAPIVDAKATYRRPAPNDAAGPRAVRRSRAKTASPYLERAMLLWPRLDRARLRKIADNPTRIAEMVERRTSQPFEVILAMLTRQSPALNPATELPTGFEISLVDSVHIESGRVALRIVRSEEGPISIQELLPA